HKLDQKAAITLHRSTDITEQNDARLFKFSLARLKLENITTTLETLAHGSAKIDLLRFTIGFPSAADARCDPPGQKKNGAPDRNAILEFQMTEIFLIQYLDRAISERTQRVRPRRVIRGQRNTGRIHGKSTPGLLETLRGPRR